MNLTETRLTKSEYGCYLAGCVWFGKLFNVSPEKIKFIPEGFDPKRAVLLRKMK